MEIAHKLVMQKAATQPKHNSMSWNTIYTIKYLFSLQS